MEPELKTPDKEEGAPDVVSKDDHGNWLCIEISLDITESKCKKLERYSALDPRYLEDIGWTGINSKPDVLCSRLFLIDDGTFCRIVVDTNLEVKDEKYLANEKLRSALISANGIDLTKLPQVPFTLLPESKSAEIRRGIFSIVMKLFETDSKGITSRDIVEECLDCLADKIRVERKQRLIEAVESELDTLIRGNLRGYLECIDGVYKSKLNVNIDHYAVKQRIGGVLQDWAGPPRHDTLERFLP